MPSNYPTYYRLALTRAAGFIGFVDAVAELLRNHLLCVLSTEQYATQLPLVSFTGKPV